MMQARRHATAAGIAIFVVLAMLASVSLVALTRAASADFTDTPNWAARQINWLADNDIAGGYDDNTFRPNLNITRAQAAYWFGNYNETITTHEQPGGAANVVFIGRTSNCPSGKRAVAGGGLFSNSLMHIVSSTPTSNGLGWQVEWRSDNGASVSGSYVVNVTCVPINP